MEVLQARHRKEQKELQGKIASKKKNATKKTRKGVNDECERLEQELRERQQAEIQALAPTNLEQETVKLNLDGEESMNEAGIETPGTNLNVDVQQQTNEPAASQDESSSTRQPKGKKLNRQKARLAKRAAEQEAQAEAAAEEAANMPDQRQQELSAMKQQMENHKLIETMIRPDGHCLYSACAHSIRTSKAQDYRDIRRMAAEVMMSHSEDFAPFMDEPVGSYTHKVKDTAEWCGHLELQAIAKGFNVNIHVLQANGHIEKIQPEQPSEKEIWLAYYKHSFGLGEHYNALQKVSAR